MGDPETEVVIPRIKNDLVELIQNVFSHNLNSNPIIKDERSTATVMLVSGGYPEKYEKGKTISMPSALSDVIVFHAGTKQEDDKLLTNGGRVMAVTAYGDDFKSAVASSLKNIEKISFDKMNYRNDIGFDL